MKHKIFFYLNLICFAINISTKPHLTVVGEIDFWGSLTRTTIGAMDILANKFPINAIRTPRNDNPINFKDMPPHVQKIVKESKNEYGKVVVLFETLNNSKTWSAIDKFPKSSLRAAISVTEFSIITQKWVNIINNKLDMVIVPDPFLIKIYKKSGVNIPIFFLPNGLYTKDFLKTPIRKYNKTKPFTFGVSSTFIPRKNNELLVDAFISAYGNNPNFRLIISGRYTRNNIDKKIQEKINRLGIKNIFISQKRLSQKEFIDFMSSIDCYVSFAKGEGFSMTPREAMLLNKPCILSNNTGHMTICNTNLVRAVPSNVKEKAPDGPGICYNCRLSDAIAALRDVYKNYDKFWAKTAKARIWASKYDYQNQVDLYMGFIKPKKIILGDRDEIGNNYIITKSKKLYDKYMFLLKP